MQLQLTKNTSNVLKVIAALMVMLHHYSQYVCANNVSDSLIYKLLSTQGGYLGVAIFFFLSGYGLMESEVKSHLNLLQFFKKRFFKIYIPVILVSAIWVVMSSFLLNETPFGKVLPIQFGGGG